MVPRERGHASSVGGRLAFVLVITLGLLLATHQAALGSCLAPVLSDQIQHADVIASGVVTAVGLGGDPITFRPSVIYRGALAAGAVNVHVGPRPGGASNPLVLVHSSVDYSVSAGTVHTLYLRRTGSELGTDSCSGSQPGPISDPERSALGSGQSLDSGAGPLAQFVDQLAALPPLIYVGLLAVVVAAIVWLRSRRRPPMTPLSGAPA